MVWIPNQVGDDSGVFFGDDSGVDFGDDSGVVFRDDKEKYGDSSLLLRIYCTSE